MQYAGREQQPAMHQVSAGGKEGEYLDPTEQQRSLRVSDDPGREDRGLTAFVGDSVPTLEILSADVEIACICVNQHCSLDRPEASAPGAAPAGESEHGGVRSGHRDATEAGGGSQIACVGAGLHCGLDRPGAGTLRSGPGWRVGSRRCLAGTQGRRGVRRRETDAVLQRVPEGRSWRDKR
ncbi:hypothetical protein NDU88_002176 [Pleurodeles waltl]|uniref:Uncharacterized protein n=1 Tax=Pleurodeles waltl TaxID=8319 RepID=A0AAV7KUL7_PLEWA|nr:hypothetical protein NDU88_002176 [Pleurodeles waltl]